jgi:DNA modification methylase
VDWDFADFSSRNFKSDINSLHWYPGSFVPQIPDALIQTLSYECDCVLDPFVGSGVTLIEAAKLGRKFIGVDINPFAIDIARAKFLAIKLADNQWKNEIYSRITKNNIAESAENYVRVREISPEVFKWFEANTLKELLQIHSNIADKKRDTFLLEKVLFSSILCKCSSQRRHYTYITDGCFPKEFVYKPAKDFFLEKVALTEKAAQTFNEQYKRRHSKEYVFDGRIEVDDSKQLEWIKDGDVDLVVTSPPYLGSHDYVKAMRLTNLFFPEKNFKKYLNNEIGARFKRHHKRAYEEYSKDLKTAFEECHRVLKPGGFMGLIMGRGKGKVIKFDILMQLLDFLTSKRKFSITYQSSRKISSRRIRFPGVMTEQIIVLKKRKLSDSNDNGTMEKTQ